MGCSFSTGASDGSEGVSHTFRVYNVDSQGMELNPGKIQVAASDLILYQKRKEPIHWPLRCLRRYGFDEELFSFESGRRCPTGPGIYAFKCRRAEELFNMVQESIQRAGQEDHLRVSSGGSGSGGGGSQGLFTHSSRPSSRPTSFAEPVVTWPSASPRLVGRLNNNSPSQQHLYINSSTNNNNNGGAVYVNTGRGSRCRGGGACQLDESAPLIAFLSQPGQRLGGPGGGARGQVNYAVLDLPSSMENLLDEEGHGAVHNFPPQANRHSMPADLSAALGPDDPLMAAGDSDVFLEDSDGAGTCPTYINVNINEPSPPQARCSEASGGSATGLAPSSGGGANAGVGGLAVMDRTSSTPNYANLGLPGAHSSSLVHNTASVPRFSASSARPSKPPCINYIQLELNSVPSSDTNSATNLSPASPTSMVSNPESPGYAKIDFNKTEALSHFTRGGTDGGDEPGARKTRHNSTIGM